MYSVTPDVLSNTPSYFSGGAVFPAGSYTISYQTGAFGFTGNTHWSVAYSQATGYIITSGTAATPWGQPDGVDYPTQAAAQAGFAGMTTVYQHPGGPIGMYCLDSPYTDNVSGSPNPTFSLASAAAPPPAAAPLVLTATPQLAGGIPAIALTWSGG